MTPVVALRGAKSSVASCVMRGGLPQSMLGRDCITRATQARLPAGCPESVPLATRRSKAERFSEKVRPEFLRAPEFRAQYLRVRHTHPAGGCSRCGRE